MANTSSVLHSLMLIFITWRGSMRCCAITVDPPEDLAVLDSGRLGQMQITWRPPSSLTKMTKCLPQYQLEYFNTYKNNWETLRTPRRTYSTQFDPSKDVHIKVYTILNGECTNNTMIMSKNCAETILKPPSTGILDAEAKAFICVYHNMENLECSWTRSLKTPPSALHNLYFWHKSLDQAVECPSYILSGGVRKGCNFSGKPLPEFTDIYFCVNGSSREGPLKATFFSLQIQNQVKVTAPDKLHLQTSSDTELEFHWENPAGRLPGHCLEWEVRHHHVGTDGKISLNHIHTEKPRLTLPFSNSNERNCFQVRSRLNSYCVDQSFWSDWSHETCHPVLDNREIALGPEMNYVSIYIYVAVVIIVILVVSLCVWAAVNMRKAGPQKKVDSLLPKLLTNNLTQRVSKIYSGKKMCTDVVI
ncbi:interleukin-13 receptor subunit alpha-2 [Xiphophorus couchianus]|uniref:interleukin-13 receptor subunit alpha-2 n=1 Tax=Xiphophorus couchianus TaxID=32473 RepID=UPI0010160CC5|nr:interleukin-13 receptor subunit alpha-2-like [Xiphophorus couchianus]XP_027887644.1 interleukin-13 receptor subunit alpha-2-like [Xiphophorus couchianus]